MFAFLLFFFFGLLCLPRPDATLCLNSLFLFFSGTENIRSRELSSFSLFFLLHFAKRHFFFSLLVLLCNTLILSCRDSPQVPPPPRRLTEAFKKTTFPSLLLLSYSLSLCSFAFASSFPSLPFYSTLFHPFSPFTPTPFLCSSVHSLIPLPLLSPISLPLFLRVFCSSIPSLVSSFPPSFFSTYPTYLLA